MKSGANKKRKNLPFSLHIVSHSPKTKLLQVKHFKAQFYAARGSWGIAGNVGTFSLTFPLFYFYFCKYCRDANRQIANLLNTGKSQEDDSINDQHNLHTLWPQCLSSRTTEKIPLFCKDIFCKVIHFFTPVHLLLMFLNRMMMWVIPWCTTPLFCSQAVVWCVRSTSGAVVSGSLHSSGVQPCTSLFFFLCSFYDVSFMFFYSFGVEFNTFLLEMKKVLMYSSIYLQVSVMHCTFSISCGAVSYFEHVTWPRSCCPSQSTVATCWRDVFEQTPCLFVYFWQGAETHLQRKNMGMPLLQ